MSAVTTSLPMAPATRWKSLNRWQAFSIHFALSLAVFLVLVALMVLFWFPGELFFLDGGWQGLKLVALIDLVLGPALTLVLWNTKKKSLVFDLCVIGALQIAALSYGFVTTYDQRTVAMVFAENNFVSVSNADLTQADEILLEKKLTPVSLASLTDTHPATLMAPIPNKDTFGQYLEDIFNGYPQASERSDQFIAIDDNHEAMKQQALDQKDLEGLGWSDEHNQELAEKGLDIDRLELYRFEARYAKGVAVFDPATMQIVDYVPMTPPPVVTEITAESDIEQ